MYSLLLLLTLLYITAASGTVSEDKPVVDRQKTSEVHRRGSRKSRCPPSRPFVDCVISPCRAERLLETQCEAHPKSVCVNQFCGGCVAKHYVQKKEVHCGQDKNVICELQNSSLSCPINHVMSIKQANYGRTDAITCRHSYNLDAMHNNTDCHSTNATQIVQRFCEGRTTCWPDVSSQVFGDPCYGIYKYLKVDLRCLPIHSYLEELKLVRGRKGDEVEEAAYDNTSNSRDVSNISSETSFHSFIAYDTSSSHQTSYNLAATTICLVIVHWCSDVWSYFP